jgi:hypothetical protein
MKAARLLALLLLVSPFCRAAPSASANPQSASVRPRSASDPSQPATSQPHTLQPTVEIAPPSSPAIQRHTLPATGEPALSHAAKLRLLREKIKYVFVLFQENRSFDFYFSTYPGADGLYSHSAADPPAGFTQPIVNLDGSVAAISPFKIPFTVTDANGRTVPLYPSDIASVNHSHTGIAAKLDLDPNLIARNDRYALTEEGITLDANGKPSIIRALPLAVRRPLHPLRSLHGHGHRPIHAQRHRHDLRPVRRDPVDASP